MVIFSYIAVEIKPLGSNVSQILLNSNSLNFNWLQLLLADVKKTLIDFKLFQLHESLSLIWLYW